MAGLRSDVHACYELVAHGMLTILLLHADPVLDGTHVIPQVQFASWLHPREHALPAIAICIVAIVALIESLGFTRLCSTLTSSALPRASVDPIATLVLHLDSRLRTAAAPGCRLRRGIIRLEDAPFWLPMPRTGCPRFITFACADSLLTPTLQHPRVTQIRQPTRDGGERDREGRHTER